MHGEARRGSLNDQDRRVAGFELQKFWLAPIRRVFVMFSAPRGNSLSAAYQVTGESRRNRLPRLAVGIPLAFFQMDVRKTIRERVTKRPQICSYF